MLRLLTHETTLLLRRQDWIPEPVVEMLSRGQLSGSKAEGYDLTQDGGHAPAGRECSLQFCRDVDFRDAVQRAEQVGICRDVRAHGFSLHLLGHGANNNRSVGFHLGHRIGHRGLRPVVGDRVMNSPHVVFMVEVEVSPAPSAVGDGRSSGPISALVAECSYRRPSQVKSDGHAKRPSREVSVTTGFANGPRDLHNETSGFMRSRTTADGTLVPRDQYTARLRAGAVPQVLRTVRRWRSWTDRSCPGREAPKALSVSVKVLDQGIRAHINSAPDASSDDAKPLTVPGPQHPKACH